MRRGGVELEVHALGQPREPIAQGGGEAAVGQGRRADPTDQLAEPVNGRLDLVPDLGQHGRDAIRVAT